MKKLLPILALVLIACVLAGCSQPDNSRLKTVTISLISETRLDSETVYVSGNQNALGNWQPSAIPLHYVSPYQRSIKLGFKPGTSLDFTITRGSFATEAVGNEGVLNQSHTRFTVLNDTEVTVKATQWLDKTSGHITLTSQDLQKHDAIWLINGWKYHFGDSSTWAQRDYNDSGWAIGNAGMPRAFLPGTAWSDNSWWRLWLFTPDTLNVNIGFSVYQFGEMELYLDGKPLYSVAGRYISDSTGAHQIAPRVLPLTPGMDHLLAVRYHRSSIQLLTKAGYDGGFNIKIGSVNALVNQRMEEISEAYFRLMLFGLIPLVLALLHLIIFFFNPGIKENIFYSLCMLGFSGLVFLNNIGHLTNDYSPILLFNRFAYLCENMAIVFGLLMMYSFTDFRVPRYAWILIGTALVLTTIDLIHPGIIGTAQDIFLILVIIEMIRKALFSRGNTNKGSSILLIGFMILVATLILQLLIVYSIIPPFFGFGNGYLYGALSLAICMSLHLSLNFAKINKELSAQLVQVKALSEKTILQERLAHEKDIEKRLLEADHARKSKELDEARQLQLSMLPANLPSYPGYEIAVHLSTATEVGGDYYDFHQSTDGTLTIVIGDATGHGVKAGTMVAITKGLFHQFTAMHDILSVFGKITSALKRMNLGQLYMGMTLLKLKENSFQVAAAGMPPVFIFRSAKNELEELRMKGMPLGSFDNFPYTQMAGKLEPGDSIIMMSDGFPEMFTVLKEQFGFERVRAKLQEVGHLSAARIIEELNTTTASWIGNQQQDDDITFVVIKRSSEST
jgi:serine phosphatase RsbU (regulator of sigma subunit)